MNYYYGLVDKENRAWGFLEEGDPRVTEDMIFLTEEQWQGLLDEQSSGKEIVFYEGRVFATKDTGMYYVDNNGIWQKKDDDSYNAEQLEIAKDLKIKENENKRQVEFIKTSIGKLKTETPLGDLKTALPLYVSIATKLKGLPENSVRVYVDGTPQGSPALSLEQFNELVAEVAMEYVKIDQHSTNLTLAINAAKTIEDLDKIIIDYENLPELQLNK